MIRDITYIGEGLIPAPINGPALRYNPLHKEDVSDIAVHHWTGWVPPETWTAGEEIAYIVRIDQYHRTTRGLDGIGYHLCPFPSGNVYIVSRLDMYGAHVGGENDHLPGIGLPGTFNLNIPSPVHLTACREAVRFIYEYLGREVPTKPHLAWGGTTCPGDRWPEWVPQLKDQATQEDTMKLLHGQPSGRVYVHGESGKRYIAPNEKSALMRAGYVLVDTPDVELASIPNVESGGGGGLSGGQVRTIFREEISKTKLS